MSRLTTAARRRPAARRGTILVVVLALLAIFAVVGIAFVFYSDGEALAARYHRESETRNGQMLPDPPGDFDSNAMTVLGQVTFGAYDNQLTSLRGHDLMSTLYGGQGTNTDPYTGQGIFHGKMAAPFDVIPSRGHVVNYTPHPVGVDMGGKTVYYAFDPEMTGPPRTWSDTTSTATPKPWTPVQLNDLSTTGQTYVSKAAPYTYPDLNNFYLASVSPATGETILPSYYRPWHFNSNPVQLAGDTTPVTPAPLNRRLEAWNPNDPVLKWNTDWVIPEGRAKILRPRPIDQLIQSDYAAAGIGALYPPAAKLSNFTNAAQLDALYKMIEKRIRDGDIIGYPRPNQDGGVTGDVFNLIGGVGTQRNDSILVDFGGRAIEWPPGSGRFVKPLAAVHISDLDGLLNLNIHGNVRGTGTNHTSHHGLGPWEVSIARAFDITVSDPALVAEANAIVAARWYGPTGVARTRNQTRSQFFAPSAGRFTAASLVSWDATGTSVPLGIPSFPTNPFNVTANYGGAGFYDDNTGATQADQHPSLFNPGEWGTFAGGGALNPLPEGATYPHADTRRLHQRHTGDYDLYNQGTLARLPNLGPTAIRSGVLPATKSLVGDAATYPPGTAKYRNDPAHGRRLLFTTLSSDLDRPRFGPSSTSPNTNPGFALGSTGTQIHPFNTALGGSLNAGGTAAILPALDINRPLADYRDLAAIPNVDNTTTPPTPTPQPISSTNIANSANAAADRQNLAHEIFARLLLATAARVEPDGSNGFNVRTYDTTTMGEVTVANIKPFTADTATNRGLLVDIQIGKDAAEFHGVRYLAQLAANIVDYVDTDDVSTVFVFRPSGGGAIGYTDASTHATNVNTIATHANVADQTSDDYLGNHIVYGVEMPRLLLNEVYAEVVNDPAETGTKGMGMPTKEGHVRFWAELVNPTTTPYASGTGPLGDGSVTFAEGTTPIRPYKITIARNAKTGFTNAADAELAKPQNVKGDLPQGAAADIDYDFRDAGAGMKANVVVRPNKGKYNPGTAHPDNGFVIVGPKANSTKPGDEFDPTNGGMPAAPFDTAIESPPVLSGTPPTVPVMEYLIPADPELKSLDLKQTAAPLRNHVVLLRRLANPYEVESATNPYITVDVMKEVPANDGVLTGTGGTGGGVPMADRFSVGRVQPFAGQAKQDTPMAAAVAAFTFPNSFTLAQTAAGAANQPRNTFGRHNGNAATDPTATAFTNGSPATMTPASLSDTILAPFDWFVHLDRPLVNELELLHVQAVKPHQVTEYTFQPPQNANEAVRRNLGFAPWLGVTTAAGANQGYASFDPAQGLPAFQTSATGPHVNATGNGLYRALELLRGKSRVFGTATGGRVNGKININTVQDARILLALLDPQAGNVFSVGEVFNPANHTDPNTIWGRYIGSRTRGLSQRVLADGTTQVFTTTPGKTVDDDPFDGNWQNLDRPFKAFGVAEAGMPVGFGTNAGEVLVGGGNSVAKDGMGNNTPFGPGLQDTLLRSAVRTYPDPADATKTLTGVLPLAYTTGTNAVHPYLQAEALRKLLNNTTTVSNAFAVHVTIVYHNVRMNTPGQPHAETIPGVPGARHYYGAEAFREVPGDMRKQYFALVDRTAAAVTAPNNNTIEPNPFQAAIANGFTLNAGVGQIQIAGAIANASNNTVAVGSGGRDYTLTAATPTPAGQYRDNLYIGSGADRIRVDITGITVDTTVTPNVATITLTQSAKGTDTRTFPAGAVLSNAVPGRPTYPAGFNPIVPTHPYQLLVPYCGRIRE